MKMWYFVKETFVNDEGQTIVEWWGPGHHSAAEALEWFEWAFGPFDHSEIETDLLPEKPEEVLVRP